MTCSFDERCAQAGLKITAARRLIFCVLSEASDHPNVELLHRRVHKRCPRIGMATVYRTLRLFEEKGIITKRDFGDGRARYECAGAACHDHLIDTASGAIVEFSDPELARFFEKIARRLGYAVHGHKLELYATRGKKKTSRRT